MVVTGPNTFKYYSVEENEFQANHTQLNNKDRELTTTYSCHEWCQDGKLLVGTDAGEIILCDLDGSYIAFIEDSPVGGDFPIECITCFTRGFIIAGNS